VRELALAASSVAAFVALLAAAEALARLRRPGALEGQPQAELGRLHRYSARYGWELRPGARVLVDGRPTTINRLGQRGAEHPLARTPGVVRVLMLGDSLAFGYGVADEETFAARLERSGFEVLNLAVPGYGTDQELLRLESEGPRWRPDVVVLNYCVENDPVDNVSRRFFYDGLHPKPFFAVHQGALVLHDDGLRLSGKQRASLWLRENSYLLQWLSPRPAASATDWPARKAMALADPDTARAVTTLLLQRAAYSAAAQGASFLLAVHPNHDAFAGRSAWAELALGAPLPADARALDMAAAYKARGLRFRDVALDSIGHLSARGHEAAAAVLAQALKR
jgi:hypothetical protein